MALRGLVFWLVGVRGLQSSLHNTSVLLTRLLPIGESHWCYFNEHERCAGMFGCKLN